jgi:prolyl-tRNA synthetase
LEKKGGFIKAYFAGTKEDEKAIKEATGATVRCFPLEDKDTRGKCFFTGKDDARMAILAKSY